MVSARLARGQYRMPERSCGPLYFTQPLWEALDSVLYGLAPAFCGACDQDALQRLCFKGTGADGLDHGLSGSPQRIFPGTFHHGANGCFPDFEQIVNAVISLLAAKSLFDLGVKSNLVYGSTEYSYAFGAAGGALGTGAGALRAIDLIRWPVSDVPSKDEAADTQGTGNVSRKLWYDHQYLVSDRCADHRQQQPL